MEGAHAGEGERTLQGHPIGWWEGETLVVDTVGFNERFWMIRGGLPHTRFLHLIERFRRVADDTLLYEYTVDDPATFTATFTAAIPMTRSADPIFEYACHEGNYGMTNMLSAGRAADAQQRPR